MTYDSENSSWAPNRIYSAVKKKCAERDSEQQPRDLHATENTHALISANNWFYSPLSPSVSALSIARSGWQENMSFKGHHLMMLRSCPPSQIKYWSICNISDWTLLMEKIQGDSVPLCVPNILKALSEMELITQTGGWCWLDLTPHASSLQAGSQQKGWWSAVWIALQHKVLLYSYKT